MAISASNRLAVTASVAALLALASPALAQRDLLVAADGSLANDPAPGPVSPDRYDAVALSAFEDALKDYPSAIIQRNGLPRRGNRRTTNGWLKWTDHFGAYVCYRVNGKNSYGGYTGFQDYALFFPDQGGPPTIITENDNYGESERLCPGSERTPIKTAGDQTPKPQP